MASLKTINTIMLGIIIVLIIIIGINMMKKNNGEKPKQPKQQSRQITMQNEISESMIARTDQNESLNEQNNDKMNYNSMNEISEIMRYQGCNLNEMEDENDALRRDTVIGKKNQQQVERGTFDDEYIKQYQNNFFNTEDNFNYSSKNIISSTDKINEIVATNNNEMSNLNGKTIANIFDGLTKNELRNVANCKNEGCVLPSSFDNIQQRKIYVDNTKTTMPVYLNYNTRYETDDVNNGGKFGDMDIFGHDNTLSPYLALID